MGEFIWIQSKGQYIPAWDFLDESPQVTGVALSAHRLICPDGEVIRCVPDDHRANHAGHSKFGALENLNRTFLGAEFLLPGDWTYGEFIIEMGRGNVGFTDEQYEAGGELYAQWMKDHDFDRPRVVTHAQVAGDDVRGEGRGKRDPGVGFNQGKLTNAIARAS
jgi:N-acetyl-anhydromuramyl-L-alanine amidase AmpD